MRAITIPKSGGPEVLTWAEVPDPRPGPGEVLIRTVASAVNRADLLQRQGHYNPPPGASPYPGLEVSGTDTATGEPLCALLVGGGYAELVAVPADHTLPVPAGLSVEEAAALPEVACTVWSNLGHDLKGKTLLVHGGGSGIGTFAIQFGVALGATVITTARRSKHDRLKALGADRTIDYTGEDWVTEVRTAGGADLILDIVGARYLAPNIEALATNGRLAIIGLQGGVKAELDLRALMAKRGSISATTLRARGHDEKTAIVRGVRDHVWPLVESGAIKPVIDRRLPMSAAAEAHRVVEASEHVGKVLLTIG
ncbi:NAD(P)H-quinone oxidoreductase [Phytohabitans sp. ZYX-F-186]|uniref:NAD(P)H-quinone oxidoreductase n=1 Tax=Phytohabitans maris TaxID=3071409 RepID=A0ABU0ZWR9_9ACTN|nr:NAD(P)H-quinone oxidoreductase [Phytohabitans sp. ZYX-F-186]MDQ7911479.1 NAD(P)H-quinone oxidoreductase [Phytohabitans sp. ZYX-F-186]